MEAINVFIDGCKQYGVSEKDLFVTLDLFERTNPNMVRVTTPDTLYIVSGYTQVFS